MDDKTIISLEKLLSLALEEDIGSGDVTSEAVFSGAERSDAVIRSKGKGIFCGEKVPGLCYEKIDAAVNVKTLIHDGAEINYGDELVKVSGSTKSILAGERIVLNFMQRMSGIATSAAYFSGIVKKSGVMILDTRKTLPGFRLLDKYSVITGGGANHRYGLYDMVMIKDNHIKAAGGIGKAVGMVRKTHGSRYRIEVETSNLAEVEEALISRADIIMLDNMDYRLMAEAVKKIDGNAKIEVSGNMDEEKIENIKDLKIDYISIGALTHSVKAFDMSMKFL